MSVPVVEELREAECWTELRRTQIGRLAVVAHGAPDIFPINYVAHEGALYFRTAPGTKLLELTVNERVALEIDSWTYDRARSVVVKGIAERLELQSEIDAAEQLPLLPWIPTDKPRWVRIIPDFVRGIAFERRAEPARYW